MIEPLLRRAPMAAGLAVSSLLLLACSTTQETGTAGPTTSAAPSTTAASGASAPAPTTTAAPAADRDCPAAGEIVVHLDGGDKVLKVSSAKASVTLGSTMEIGIGNFTVADDQVEAIAPPTLTADQLYVNVHLSATKGTIEPGTYTSVSDELGPLQLNASEADTVDGKVYVSGFASVKENVKITKVDKAGKQVCGVITTQTFEGAFSADIIKWSE